MSTIATTYTTAGSLDASRTIMNWLSAIFSTKPVTLAASNDVASFYKVGYRMALLRRAKELDAVSPRKAAELRKLASAA